MDSLVLATTYRPVPAAPRWEKIFLVLVGTLTATILLKIGPIQYLEIIYLGQIAYLFANFLRSGSRTTFFKPYLTIGICYGVFGLVSIILAIAALRFTFYLPVERSALTAPVMITLSRNVELAAAVIITLYIADIFRKQPEKLRFTMRVYFWTGVASAIYSYISYPLDVLGIASLGSYSIDHRLRGFYNEGGPYGPYLLTIFSVGLVLRHQQWEPRRRLNLGLACLPLAFIMADSKAGISELLALLVLHGILARSLAKRVVIVSGVLLALFFAMQFFDLASGLRVYQRSSAAYERASHLHAKDPNFVYGRIAGAFIVPRMIAAHPLTGIGWGNYGITRNTPEFRGASSWVDMADNPGLGLVGYAAELGLPLFAFLLITTVLPVVFLRRLRTPTYVLNLAMMQPLAELFGAQLNLTYPWVTTAFALGLAYAINRQQKLQGSAARLPLPSGNASLQVNDAQS